MNFAHTFFHRPQHVFLRKALFQIHLWAGLIAGLYIFVIGVTGSAIVFRDEIELKMYADLQQVSDTTTPQVPYRQVVETVKRAHPAWNVFGLYPPAGERNTFMVYINQGRNFQAAFVHPHTGRELGLVDPAKSFLRWIEDLHVNLLAGPTGRTVNGVGSFALLLLCFTGLVVWWPGRRRWKSGFTINFHRRWKRINWDLHNVVGFWTLAILVIWGISGVYFCFPTTFTAAVNWMSPISFVEPAGSKPPASGPSQVLSIEEILHKAQPHVPGKQVIGLLLPAGPRGMYTLMFSPNHQPEFDTAEFLYFDQYNGTLLSVWNRGVNRTLGDLIMNWMAPLHFGTFGSGPVKILWVILGLSLPLLFVTGAIMWWNRVFIRRYRQWKHSTLPPKSIGAKSGERSEQAVSATSGLR